MDPIAPELLVWRRPLLGWYRRSRRPLPWRATRNPYRIWVSEVMLQQTQVATALPYYRAFLRRFPTVAALAAAGEPEVMAAWSGLGYYRRARHLRAAARQVVTEHGGRVPSDYEAFFRLPGVGRYTAGAVLSIAFDRPLPVLDGNVARVLSRWFARPTSIRQPRGAQALWKLASSMVPMRRPGDWNQALMELGATVCLPRAPKCQACPVRAHCRARRLGRPEAYPPAAPRRPSVKMRRAVAVIERGGRIWMTRRQGPLLDGLWEPPGVEIGAGTSARVALGRALRSLGMRARLEPTGETIRHTITHRAIEVEVWRGREAEPTVPAQGHWASRSSCRSPARSRARFVDPRRPSVPLTALASKLARLADGRRS